MDDPLCKICRTRHRLGPCPSSAKASEPGRVANRRLPKPSSGNSVEALAGEDGIALISTAPPHAASLIPRPPPPGLRLPKKIKRLSLLAREGDCEFCDRRRAADAARLARHREKKATAQ